MHRHPPAVSAPVPSRPPARLALLLMALFAFTTPGRGFANDLYVLAIGVSAYQDSHIPPLTYADDDARAVARWAASQEGHLYRKVHSLVLTNDQASRRAVIQQLVEFFRPAEPDDQLLLFIAGHGLVDRDTQAYHFLTYDTDLEAIAGTALEQDDILKKLEGDKRAHNRVVTLVDTCQAGALSEAIPQQGRGVYLVDQTATLSDERVRDKTNVWVVFTAGTAQDAAQEGPQYRLPGEPPEVEGHGLFTHALLRALGGTAADHDHNGTVTLVEFQAFVSELVREQSAGKQLPVMSGKQMDMALAWAVGTEEVCDGVDNDMDGEVDEGFDHNGNEVGDCLETELCNGEDDNGDGRIDEGYDLDGDGHTSMELCGSEHGDDCDDHQIARHPGQQDWGNLRDDDCDGLIDEDDFDQDHNLIPDFMQTRARQLSRGRWLALGAGGVLTAGGAAALARLSQLEKPPEGVQDPYFLTPEQVSQYRRWRYLSTGLLSAGIPLVGVSVGLTFYGIDFRHRYFPKRHSFEVKIGPASSGAPGRSEP